MAPIDLRNPDRPIRAGVILTGGVTEILDVAPMDLIYGLSKTCQAEFPVGMVDESLEAQAMDFEFYWVNETGKTARMTSGIHMQTTHSFEDCPQLDIVLMGAHNMGYKPTDSECAFVRKQYEGCAAFLTICAGFETALYAGILEGKTATGPRMMMSEMKKQAPGVKWVEQRWANDGKVWTSGVLLNGLELMRAFTTEIWGGQGGLVDFMLRMGNVPDRDQMYADAGDNPL